MILTLWIKGTVDYYDLVAWPSARALPTWRRARPSARALSSVRPSKIYSVRPLRYLFSLRYLRYRFVLRYLRYPFLVKILRYSILVSYALAGQVAVEVKDRAKLNVQVQVNILI